MLKNHKGSQISYKPLNKWIIKIDIEEKLPKRSATPSINGINFFKTSMTQWLNLMVKLETAFTKLFFSNTNVSPVLVIKTQITKIRNEKHF